MGFDTCDCVTGARIVGIGQQQAHELSLFVDKSMHVVWHM